MSNVIVVFCTVSTKAEAQEIAKALLEKRLCACVNITEGIHSMFIWNDKIEEEKEHLMIIKTIQERFEKLKLEIKSLHSYDMPEIIAMPITLGSNSYLEWVRESA